MNKEKILEIARRYTVPKEESSLLVEYDGDVPTPTGETLNLVMWNFCEEELIAFAQSVLEADRESSDEPVAWAYITKDCKIVHYEFVEGLVPLYRRPSLARKPLSEDEIRSIMLANGFTIKDGCEDLKPYVFRAVRAIEQKIWGNSE